LTAAHLGVEHRMPEDALYLSGALDAQAVLVGKLVDPEDGDDVLQLLVALENLLHPRSRSVVLVRDDPWLERTGARAERIDRRVDALLRDRALQRDERVEVGKGVRRRRIGEVVRRDVDRLHRCN